MTRVVRTFFAPDPGPDPVGARGYVRWAPLVPGRLPEGTVLPLPFRVALDNGLMDVDVASTDVGWIWAVTFQIYGLRQETRYYLVPDSTETLDLSTLVQVDPQTADPTEEPQTGWLAYLDAIADTQVGVVHVVTGNEPRVDFGTVIWIGGTTQPVNMAEQTDIWFKPAA